MNFNTKSVSNVVGLTRRQIDYWDKSDLIKPSVQEASGYGTVRLYSFSDLVQFRVAKKLIDKGISVQKIRKALWHLKKNMPDIRKPLLDLAFLTDGETIFVITGNDKEIMDTLRNGQLVISVALGKIIVDLKGEVKEMEEARRYTVTIVGKKYTIAIRWDAEDGGYWTECEEMPGCGSQGETLEEALEMTKDAIKGCQSVLAKRERIRKAS